MLLLRRADAPAVVRHLRADERVCSQAGVATAAADRSLGSGIHCGGCIQKIERALARPPGVELRGSTSRPSGSRSLAGRAPPPFIATLERGWAIDAHLYDPALDGKDSALSELVRALAVAGFAASNIMMLSVSVWSGADAATRDLFHWLSAIDRPAGAGLFRPHLLPLGLAACSAHGHTNMDVPISIGVLLAFGMSLYETIHHGPHAYFDAAISLLFFLLIGRTLDHMMRERARTAVKGLARLAARGALGAAARRHRGATCRSSEIKPGMTILLAAGERIPVDARVVEGRSDLDCSLVTGESEPQPVGRRLTGCRPVRST